MSWKTKLAGQASGGGYRGKVDPSADRTPGAYTGYRTLFTSALRGIEKCTFFDIDGCLEVSSQLRSIFEYKRYDQVYQEIMIPYPQYVSLKKMALRLAVPCYITVEQGRGRGMKSGDGSSVWVVKLNQEEKPADRPGKNMPSMGGGLFAPFNPDEGAVMTPEEFSEFMDWVAKGTGGGSL